jgi:uncharacterized protein (DUF58 family)
LPSLEQFPVIVTTAVKRLSNAAPDPARLVLDDLLGLRRLAKRVVVPARRPLSAPRAGPARSRALGRGLDFAEVREYRPGDDLRQIDWNVTARTGKPHTKLFIEERERPVFICVDLRPSMHFGTRGSFKSVAAGRLAALLAWTAVAGNDRVGGLVFNGSAHRELKPTSGHRAVGQLAQALVQLDTSDAGQNGEDLPKAMARLRRLAHTGATIYLISDFRGFDETVEVYLNWLIKHNEFIAVHISDPLERELPPAGVYPLLAGAVEGRLTRIDTHSRAMRSSYHGSFRARYKRLAQFFSGRGNWCAQLSTGEDVADQAERVLRRLIERED